MLEDFAGEIASTGTSEHIAQVYDQYLNFIVAEPDLFSLGLGNDAYWKINSPQTSDEDLDVVVDRIVSGLFSVSVTMGMCVFVLYRIVKLTKQAQFPSSGVPKEEQQS